MERLMIGRTVFMIAHRLRSAVTADLIVVLGDGRIVETGRHKDLMRRGGVYAGLFSQQTSGLELPPDTRPRMASFQRLNRER
jgi:ABC-type multidrug transport system fused ATPase/permease subunit